jgi:hypothetical protein
VTVDELDCAIYVDAPDREALLARVLETTGGTRAGTTVELDGHELDVDDNDEADPVRRTPFPDGFLHFAQRVEVYAAAPPAAALVTRLLDAFWGAGWPAVAACDYEQDLPHGGGYRSDAVPWPAG